MGKDIKEFKGTQGKWKHVFREATEYYPENHEIQYGEDGECLAEFVHDGYDAQLIAVAPELLSVLLKVQKAINEMDYSEIEGLYDEVEETINKALGKENEK